MLAGTPTVFAIPPERLVELAKYALLETDSGVTDDSVLAEDFRSAAGIATRPHCHLCCPALVPSRPCMPSLLDRPFPPRFEFPIVSLDREAYLKAVQGFKLKQGIPDLSPNA